MPHQQIREKTAGFAVFLAVSLFLTSLLFISGIIDFWNLKIYDRCINSRVFGTLYTQNRIIATIDITDSTIETLTEQLDTREAFTQAVDILSQSNASIVFDFLFRHAKQDDALFVSAVEQANNLVIASVAVDEKIMDISPQYSILTEEERQMLRGHLWHIRVLQKGNIPRAGTFLLPFPALGSATAQIGLINIEPDNDGIYRRIPLFYEWEDGFIPSLSLAAAVLHYEIQTEDIILKAGEYLDLPLQEDEIIRIPVDEQGCMLIPYFETWKNNTNRIPFHRIVNAAKDSDDFNTMINTLNNRIALVSEINTSQKDFGPTSFERLFPLSGAHVAVLSAILNGFDKRVFIWSMPLLYKILILVFFIFCAFVSNNFRKDTLFHLGYFISLLSLSGLMFFLWQYAAIAPWYALPATMIFFLWMGAFLVRLVARYQEQLLLQNTLSRYFPRALAERIMREQKTELIPAYKELTMLFADISGFTRWSSEKEPEQVHAFLNDYLENMADILFAYGGTVDKYMGDGILAFFGDPLEMPDHIERCLRAAIAMQEKNISLAEKWKPLVDIDLKVRIGINTGKVIVGNLGTKTRIEYTVIGAAVNIAQRMESNAPLGGILVTAAVREKVKDIFTFSEKKNITAKGYTDPVEAYVLTGVSHQTEPDEGH
jgi:adenylate cyclase